MAAHEQEFTVHRMCHALGVPRSGYYAWKRRPLSARDEANRDLLNKITEAFEHSRCTYGSVRIRQYWLRRGVEFSRLRVARLMKKAQIIPRKAEKWHPQTTRQRMGARVAPNLLNHTDRGCQYTSEEYCSCSKKHNAELV